MNKTTRYKITRTIISFRNQESFANEVSCPPFQLHLLWAFDFVLIRFKMSYDSYFSNPRHDIRIRHINDVGANLVVCSRSETTSSANFQKGKRRNDQNFILK